MTDRDDGLLSALRHAALAAQREEITFRDSVARKYHDVENHMWYEPLMGDALVDACTRRLDESDVAGCIPVPE
jgi:hypothetical protein